MVLIPEDMKVTLNRRDTSKQENVRWLVRNLPVQTRAHLSFDDVIRLLKLMMRCKPRRLCNECDRFWDNHEQ